MDKIRRFSPKKQAYRANVFERISDAIFLILINLEIQLKPCKIYSYEELYFSDIIFFHRYAT